MTKEDVLNAVRKQWLKDFRALNNKSEDDHRDGYFMLGFIESALDNNLPSQVQTPTIADETLKWAHDEIDTYATKASKWDGEQLTIGIARAKKITFDIVDRLSNAATQNKNQ